MLVALGLPASCGSWALKEENMKNHIWTDNDDQALLAAIIQLEPLLEHYREQKRPKVSWWDAVAGKLAPAVQVTGKACSRRELVLRRRHEEQVRGTGDVSTWERVANLVEVAEQELADATYDAISRVESKLDAILRALGVEHEE